MINVIKIKKLDNLNAKIPTKNKLDAGWDLYSSEDNYIEHGDTITIKTDISIVIPQGFYGQIFDRSGIAFNRRLHTMGGVIDSSYRGEIKIIITNLGLLTQVINKGDRIAQLVILPVPEVELVEVDSLENTERGNKGFGSSGD
jgi:dUTP diphosphatase